MNKLKKILLTTLLLVILPTAVYADCQSDFKAVEKDFSVTYEYNKDTDDYKLVFFNPNRNRYSIVYANKKDTENLKISTGSESIRAILNNYNGNEYTYQIIALYGNCNKKVVKKETIKLYNYNPYADNPLCNGNEEFILCQKEYSNTIDQATFESRIKAYIENKNNEKEIEKGNEEESNSQKKKDNKENLFTRIIEYIKKNLLKVAAIILFALAVIITVILQIRSAVKSRRLE